MLLRGMPLTTGKPRFDQTTIGLRIRAKREELGYTAASLGDKVGIAESAMLKKEKGKAPFYFHELEKICNELKAPALFPILDWETAWFVERMIPDTLRAAPVT